MTVPCVPDRIRKAALSRMLQRCSVGTCRKRERLRCVPLVDRSHIKTPGHVVYVCRECLGRVRAGDFSKDEMERWKLRGPDYWENVGAD